MLCSVFEFPPNKPFKMKKVPAERFEECMGGIEASIRFGSLNITSENVSVRFDPSTGEVTFSGKYGLPGSGDRTRKKLY